MATLTTIPTQPARRRWNTLEILSRSRTGLFVITALLMTVTLWAAYEHHGAMKLVGKDTVPSIIAAQKIKIALADMDSDAVKDLLYPSSTRNAGAFEDRRLDAANSLIGAASNVTYGRAEQEPIDTIGTVMGTYARLVQQARDLQDGGDQAMAVRYYRAAGIVMDGTLLPAADALDKANNDVLTDEYTSRSTRSLVARVLTALIGVGLLFALMSAQLFLSKRTQRTLNPALAAATLLTLGLTVYAFTAMARAQSDLDTAKLDAFSSIHALLQARAVAYSADAQESRFLLDPVDATEYQRRFSDKSATLVHTASPFDRFQLLAQLRSGETVPGFTGYLADELKNITFNGERESAINTVAAYELYLSVDAQMRTLDGQGMTLDAAGSHELAATRHAEAVALDVGTQEGQSEWALKNFNDALTKTLDINQAAYDSAINSGFEVLSVLDWTTGILGLLIALLIFFGFAPRIREYQ